MNEEQRQSVFKWQLDRVARDIVAIGEILTDSSQDKNGNLNLDDFNALKVAVTRLMVDVKSDVLTKGSYASGV